MKTLKQIEYQLQADAPYNLGSPKEIGYGCGVDSALNHPQIVLAVNMHEELLEACRKASTLVDYYRRAVMTGHIVGTHSGALVQGDYEVMDSLDKAIRKAEAL